MNQGLLEFSCTGHRLPLHLRAETGTAELLGNGVKHSGALGLMDGGDFQLSRASLKLNDGISEVFNVHNQEFGIEGLRNSARKLISGEPDQFLEQVLQHSLGFSGDARFADDVSLILADWRS